MKLRILLLAVLLAVPATVMLRAQEPKKHVQEEETELEGKMEKMGGAFRKLKRQIADPTQNAASLQLVATIRAAAEEASRLTPAKSADVPAADRAKFEADYQAKMKNFTVELGKLEAVKLVADLGALQKAGHKEFKRPDEKK